MNNEMIPEMTETHIANKIVEVRHEKVILDFCLAEFYGIETRALKQAVRRNFERFPEDFMFELTEDEMEMMVSQNVIPSKKHYGGATPFSNNYISGNNRNP